MPIYEEKLISPLAIRFTQDYIRTSFRDGHQVETTMEEIKAEPGTGQYDLVLRVPFPHIEIIRWRIPRYGVGRTRGQSSKDGGAEAREHWFTLDNRRLYCLQRAAVALWPKRVAAVVEILYADPGTVWKKYDSATHGWSVNLGPSATEMTTDRWDWREHLLPLELNAHDVPGVLEMVLADDKKRKVGDMPDAPERQSLLLVDSGKDSSDTNIPVPWSGALGRCLSNSKLELAFFSPKLCPTPSTTVDGSDESDGASGFSLTPTAAAGNCNHNSMGERPTEAKRGTDRLSGLVQCAMAEVDAQVQKPGFDGLMWITKWNTRYGQHLGPLRTFLERYPEKFKVMPIGGSKKFTVFYTQEGNTRATHVQ